MKILPILLILISLAGQSLAKSPVWKVTKQGRNSDDGNTLSLYLGGTIHVLSQQDYPLPAAFDRAYSNSEILVFETDIEEINNPEIQAKMLSVMMFQDDRTLQQSLRSTTYSKLETYMAQRKLPIANFTKFTPAGLSLTLTIIELQRLGLMNSVGVDSYYSLRGKNEGKLSEELESVTEQIGFIDSMNKEDSDQLILSTMQDSEGLSSDWKALLNAWREGSVNKLEELGIAPMRKDFPTMYEFLLVDRNNNWMPKIHAMLTTPEVELLLVGSLHLVGPDGLLSQLRAAGYKVEQEN